MTRQSIRMAAWAALLLVFIPLAGRAADTQAEWLKRPTPEDLLALFPAEALRNGTGGKATIRCVVTVQGALRACAIVSESPAGAGFGAAAMALTPQFLMKPATHDGKPTESEVRIPLDFAADGPQTGSNIRGVSAYAPITTRYFARMVWVGAPSFGDVLAAFPAKARVPATSGRATLDCGFGKTGGLATCSVLNEEPKGFGFGAAAKALAQKFAAPGDPASLKILAGGRIQVPFTFDASILGGGAPLIGKPEWATLPSAEDLAASMPANQCRGRSCRTGGCKMRRGGRRKAGGMQRRERRAVGI